MSFDRAAGNEVFETTDLNENGFFGAGKKQILSYGCPHPFQDWTLNSYPAKIGVERLIFAFVLAILL